MGRPPLHVERTTVHLSPGTGERFRRLVRNYKVSEFIRTLVDRELDRLERSGVSVAEATSTGVAVEGPAEVLPSDRQERSILAEPAARVGEDAPLAFTPNSPKKRSTCAVGRDMAARPARASWRSMRQNSRETGHPIVPAWNDFRVFENDMGPKPPGAILVRRDQSQGWSPDNCTWSTKAEVNQNRPTNSRHTIDGQTKTSAEWARSANMNSSTFRMRVNKLGWSAKKAIETPVPPAPAPGPWKIKRRSAKSLMPIRKKDPRYKLWKDMRRRCRTKGDTYVPEWGSSGSSAATSARDRRGPF
ncbi:hypothetical protein ACRAWG_09700 [Methylobacterium sp. P31]